MSTARKISNTSLTANKQAGTGFDEKVPFIGQVPLLADGVPCFPTSTDILLNDFLVDPGFSNDMRVDGSVTPVIFSAGPPQGTTWQVTALELVLADVNMQFNEFAGLGLTLTNGILAGVGDITDTINFDYLNGEPIKTNGDFVKHIGPLLRQPFEGTGPTIVAFVVLLDFVRRFNKPLTLLEGSALAKFIIIVQDNLFVGLDMFVSKLYGWKYPSA